jgi:hypothetical protein
MRSSHAIRLTPTVAAAAIFLAAAILPFTAACSNPKPVQKASEATEAAADAYAKGLVRGIERSKRDRAVSDLDGLRRALEQYAADSSGYPDATSCADLLSKVPSRGVILPEKDPWGNDYSCSTSQTAYSLRSPGEDGAWGTPDDIAVEGGAPPAP